MGIRLRYAQFQENLFSTSEITLIFCLPLFRKRPITCLHSMTKMVTMPIYGENPLKLFSRPVMFSYWNCFNIKMVIITDMEQKQKPA